MWGAVLGDIVGSIYEFNNLRRTDFELFTEKNFFTDDTVLTAATCSVFLQENALQHVLETPTFGTISFATAYRDFGRRYPHRGYGGMFSLWLGDANMGPYYSLGNGSAMRASPIGYVAQSFEQCLRLAELSASVTHNHPEGILGAQVVACIVFWAQQNKSLSEIKGLVEKHFPYNTNLSLDYMQETNRFDETCNGTLPVALSCLFQAKSFEDAIRKAVSVGGDTDTICCIVGACAEPLFKIPPELKKRAESYLREELTDIFYSFEKKFMSG